MRLKWICVLALAVCAAIPAVAQDDEQAVNWLTSYRQAVDEAKKTGKPIFLEYRCEP